MEKRAVVTEDEPVTPIVKEAMEKVIEEENKEKQQNNEKRIELLGRYKRSMGTWS